MTCRCLGCLSSRLRSLRLKRFQVRSREYDDRAGGIADATRRHGTNQNRSYPSVPVTAHNEKPSVLRGFYEPLDRWPLDNLDRQSDIVSIGLGHPVYLLYLSLFGSFPGMTGDRCLGQTSMRVVSKGSDDLHTPTPTAPLLQSPLQRPVARL